MKSIITSKKYDLKLQRMHNLTILRQYFETFLIEFIKKISSETFKTFQKIIVCLFFDLMENRKRSQSALSCLCLKIGFFIC